ncbi:hypothetical protein [Methylobacterium oxalidis]|uniref:Uncharacterized protein n=1 Tax=Methylobacterium oxalidis TaxID=944322 RepID=A0A512J1G6_9HYPH|nr:hypothetical protein [Methylobacterium oxalidis]GEP03699.1 hypothetical protein MOX02_17370 [Methylobacterium oxalidis]GJE33695.1 hypothetical protein LDDCCGHA_3898 [Methylobacterium oxalidis]GLS62283.1 hypothetical protein GCM10007888_06640 [Methylobacterium oxalidis]
MPRPRKAARVVPAEMRAAAESGYVDRPVYVPAPVTLVATTTAEVTDTMIGLPEDPIAQERAVAYLKAALAFRSRQHTTLPRPVITAVEVPLRDDALEIIDLVDRDLADALGRLVNRPLARFLTEPQ